MSEKNKDTNLTKTLHQRREDALERRRGQGLKVDNAFSDRHIDVMKDYGKVDENNRIPSTRMPESRKHHSTDSKPGLGRIAVATALTIGGGLAVINQAPDTVVPNPGNMKEFRDDPLQAEYDIDPDSFTLESGQIVRVDSASSDDELAQLEILPSPQVISPVNLSDTVNTQPPTTTRSLPDNSVPGTTIAP